MKAQIKKRGNGAVVKIPASVVARASLRLDQTVDIRAEDGRIIIELISSSAYDLDRMLDLMTPESFPEPTDFGSPVGGEHW